MKVYQYQEWIDKAIEFFGKDSKNWKFKCCNCGHEQSIKDFEEAGIETPDNKVFFSCIGRWTQGEGTLGNKKSPCNYTLGGLFSLNEVQVIDKDGATRKVFDFGAPILQHQ